MSVLTIFPSTLIQKNDIVWDSQECDVPPAFQAKQSVKAMVWGDMEGRGLTKLHMLPSAKP